MTIATGWTPDAIREAIRARGTTIAALAVSRGMKRNALSSSLTASWRQPKAHRIIADFLGRTLHELWPRWYPPGQYRNEQYNPKFTAAAFDAVLKRVAGGEKVAVVCAEAGQPSETAIAERRRRNPDFASRWAAAMTPRRGVRVSAERLDRITAHLEAGCSLRSLARDRVISRTTIALYARSRPALASSIRTSLDARRAAREAAREAARRAVRPALNPHAHREAFVRALRQDEVYAVVEAAVPRGLPPDMRDDVKSDLVVALLTGEIQPAGAAAAARRYMAAWNRAFLHHDQSLDAERDGSLGLAGVLADQSFDLGDSGIRVRQAAW